MATTQPRLTRHSPELLEIRFHHQQQESFEFFLASDIHLDNPHCDRKLLAKHLDQLKARNGHALFFGDLLCLMQGKRDRRASKGAVMPEHYGANYFDLVFRECADWLAPWADQLLMVSDGNHETAVINNQEIDPLENLVRRLRDTHGARTEHLRYQGWVWFTFTMVGSDRDHRTRRTTLFFHHGAWGGVITKGTMGGGRYASIAPDARILVNGHNHERSVVSHPCYRINNSGKQRIEQRWHLQTGTYKEEFSDGAGWAVERIVMPKSLGGIWLRLTPTKHGVDVACEPA